MTLTVPTSSKITILRLINGNATAGDMQLHLYANDLDVNLNTSIHDLTSPTAAEYLPKDLNSSQWTYLVNEPVAIVYPTTGFLFLTTGDTIHGFYVTLKSTGQLLWIEDIDPFEITSTGDQLLVTTRLELLNLL